MDVKLERIARWAKDADLSMLSDRDRRYVLRRYAGISAPPSKRETKPPLSEDEYLWHPKPRRLEGVAALDGRRIGTYRTWEDPSRVIDDIDALVDETLGGDDVASSRLKDPLLQEFKDETPNVDETVFDLVYYRFYHSWNMEYPGGWQYLFRPRIVAYQLPDDVALVEHKDGVVPEEAAAWLWEGRIAGFELADPVRVYEASVLQHPELVERFKKNWCYVYASEADRNRTEVMLALDEPSAFLLDRWRHNRGKRLVEIAEEFNNVFCPLGRKPLLKPGKGSSADSVRSIVSQKVRGKKGSGTGMGIAHDAIHVLYLPAHVRLRLRWDSMHAGGFTASRAQYVPSFGHPLGAMLVGSKKVADRNNAIALEKWGRLRQQILRLRQPR